jgi:hypothetical protein
MPKTEELKQSKRGTGEQQMNKPRLIDANELITTIAIYVNANAHVSDTPYDAYWNVIQWIKEQSTAYDIDKVVKQLEEKAKAVYNEIEGDYINYVALENAIEIVKGGVE